MTMKAISANQAFPILVCLSTFVLTLTPGAAYAVRPDSTDAREIMTAVERREKGDKMIGRMQLDTNESGKAPRNRVVQIRSMNFPLTIKQMILFESPANVRNTALLTFDYDEGGRSDDQWIYFPNLKKTNRIQGGDRAGSFMGTDFSYSDMTQKDPSDYDYKLITPSVKIGDEECWLIESVPRTSKEQKETGYEKLQVWISKSKLLPIQQKCWLSDGKKIKYTQFKDIRQVDGIWVAHKLIARVMKGSEEVSSTVLTFTELRYNQAQVVPADFTERRMEQGL